MTYRVIQWSTGNVGRLALHAIIEHPDLELAGVWVHDPDKAGRDAGELAGLPPVGVTATNDADALLALDADVVSHNATGDLRPHEAVAEMCACLESGKNVVSTSVVSLLYPPSGDRKMVERLEQACATGGASCFTSGIDPGFANDLLPLTLAGFCERVDAIHVQEILNYATYDQPEVLFETMGFGKPLDQPALMLLPGSITLAWGGVVAMMADALGVQLDGIEEVRERRGAEETFTFGLGTIEAGTMEALRFEVQGIVNGRPAIVVEHVTRLRDDAAPDWPQPTGTGSYRIRIDGRPSLECELRIEGPDGDHNTGGLICTAMRLLNAIPAVCEAPPGLLSAVDLPLVTARHTTR
ncbi:MAG TPA: diacylglycerol kinase [Acidimicrobiia bacterium]|nr:diacylglycerol kinase [Acidimicrobiia bacterium]